MTPLEAERIFLIFAAAAMVLWFSSLGLSLVAMVRPRRAVFRSSLGLAFAVIGFALPLRMSTWATSDSRPEPVTWRFDSRIVFVIAIAFAVVALVVALQRKPKSDGTE